MKSLNYLLLLCAIVWFIEPTSLQAHTNGETGLTESRYAASDNSAPDSLKQKVDRLMVEYDSAETPGAVVGVVRDGKVIFSRGYGLANLPHKVPITPQTRFNIASISKQFTGFAFALLEQQGKLALDEPARKYLPELPDFEETVTLKHLLTHTSGYREAYGTLALSGLISSRDYLSREETVEVVRRQRALEFSPGSHRRYNSTAYVVLALILEEVTETSFPKWMKENVFDPIGMNNTVIESEVGQVIPGSAPSYYFNNKEDRFVTAFSNRAIYGSAEIYTTVDDLARWMRNFHTADVGGPAVQDRLRRRFVLTSGDTTHYGLGIRIDRERGLSRVHHSGAHAGYGSKLNYYPELNAGVVVMSNHDELNAGRVARKVGEIFFGRHMDPQEEQSSESEKSITVDTTRLKNYTGRYRTENGKVVSFDRRNTNLYLNRSPEDRFSLDPTSDTTFHSNGGNITVEFRTNNTGDVQYATLKDSISTRLHPLGSWNPTVKALQAYTGHYVSPELETIYTVSVSDSQLVAEHRRNGRLLLAPVKNAIRKGTFETEKGTIRPETRFEYNENGTVTGFYASLWRTEKVWFQKRE